MRKNRLQGDVDALQEGILRLIDFAHTSFGDETDNDETIDQDLTCFELPCGRQRKDCIVVAGNSVGGRAAPHRMVKKIKGRVLEKATGACILG